MARWDYVLKDNSSAVLGVLPAKSRTVNRYLNLPGAASFELKLKYDDAAIQTLVDSIDPYRTYVRVERAEVGVFEGEVQEPVETLQADAESFVVPVLGYLALFDDRYTADTVSYAQIDQGEIAGDLLTDTQAQAFGDFGIVNGALATGILRDRTYEAKCIGDAIEELAACEDGFDFEITQDKVFNVYSPRKGVYVQNFIFEHGKNIEEVTRKWLKPINFVRAIGAGEGETMLRTTVYDAASIALYGIRETILSLKDISEQSTLEQRANEYLAQNAFPVEVLTLKIIPQADPGYGAYDLGDYVRVKVDYGRMQVDSFVRILGIETTISDEDKEEVTLVTNT